MPRPNLRRSHRGNDGRSGAPRVWRVPPALFRDPDCPEAFEGVSILSEIPGELGLAVYQVFRDVHLWADVPDTSGCELFANGAVAGRASLIHSASPEPGLRADLETLSAVLQNDAPREAAVVTEAALSVSRWANGQSAGRTAILFAQVASAASPGSASAALEAGRMAAADGRYTVAETWLRRAVAVARRGPDMESYCGALTELSRVYLLAAEQSGARARSAAATAARMARRHGLRLSGARARHQLALVELTAGRPAEAEHQARYACKLYSRQSSEAPGVLHLIAEAILAQRARTPEAIGILQKLLPLRHAAPERFRTLMLLIRAAGTVRDKRLLESAWLDALAVIELMGGGERAAEYLLELARAAADALERQRAAEAARRALALATRRGDQRLIAEIGGFIEQAHLRSLAPRPPLD